MASSLPKPPYDPVLQEGLDALKFKPLKPHLIPQTRINFALTAEDAIGVLPLKHADHEIPGPGGPLAIAVFEPNSPDAISTAPRPAILHFHGGGMIIGNRFFVSPVIDFAVENNAVIISPEYRLAPEHPFPAGHEDGYASLLWLVSPQILKDLNIDRNKIILAGNSGGACIAAGVALKNRDRDNISLAGLALYIPMLDDRNITVSSRQYVEEGSWSRKSNILAWSCVLGNVPIEALGDENFIAREHAARPGQEVEIYAAPGRAKNLAGLPPTYLDIGACEVFRDEVVDFASGIWRDGGDAELHVWRGGFHGFSAMVPGAAVSLESEKTRKNWIKRILNEDNLDTRVGPDVGEDRLYLVDCKE